jgi:hypothetical protein
LLLTAVAAVFLALKFVFHIHFSLFDFGFYLAVLLAAALVLLASRARQSQVGGPIARSGG